MKKLQKSNLQSVSGSALPYIVVVAAFFIVTLLQKSGNLEQHMQGMLVPVCCYIVMALSLNLTVGIMGELSIGHAGFMSLGAFSGVVASQSLIDAVPNTALRLALSIACGACVAAVGGFLIGLPVLRLRGDYLAIVTLAFGEIIRDIITCLIVGHDKNGLHILFNFRGTKTVADLELVEGGLPIIKGAQGAIGTTKISSFGAGVILILIALFIILNFIKSRTGRAVIAIRDNRIAAESVGVEVMKNKMIAFVISTTLAGAAGALYGLNYTSLAADKFDFNKSILVLVFVVLGGLGNMLGSIISATVLTLLPEVLRGFDQYRMLIYAIVLILVMLATNSPKMKALLQKLLQDVKTLLFKAVPKRKSEGEV
ncbi:MAG: branched-chain amino acid ABC transporter permease [Clostridia bacterium]|nr:branched-chain amino acid ABC transporter permease [Clostridia bacterium]MBR0509296.1 branched-chain amino acid ABC transporter permease [Clostridia bacterium]MBR0536762.1 branched-chain amino acid ABC transporter permease [Clostridia bacterium]